MKANNLPGTPKHILVIRLDNIGDLVMLGPALRSVRAQYPDARITLLASPAGCEVAAMLPWVDDWISWRASWQEISHQGGFNPQKEARLIEILKLGRFDLALVFTSFSQTPYPAAYASALAGIPIRAGLANEFGGQILTHWIKPGPEWSHQVDRNLSLVEGLGIKLQGKHLELSVPASAAKGARNFRERLGVRDGDPYIVVAPGASCTARQYEEDRFAKIACQLSEHREMDVLVVGHQREIDRLPAMTQLASQNHRIHNLIGQTSLTVLGALIADAALVIANNSASLHIADAFQRPLVVLYSGTEYVSQWEPRSSPAAILRKEVACSPCYLFQCPTNKECLDIPVSEVVEEAEHLLDAYVTTLSRDGRPLETFERIHS